MNDELDGLTVRLPSATRNLRVDGNDGNQEGGHVMDEKANLICRLETRTSLRAKKYMIKEKTMFEYLDPLSLYVI